MGAFNSGGGGCLQGLLGPRPRGSRSIVAPAPCAAEPELPPTDSLEIQLSEPKGARTEPQPTAQVQRCDVATCSPATCSPASSAPAESSDEDDVGSDASPPRCFEAPQPEDGGSYSPALNSWQASVETEDWPTEDTRVARVRAGAASKGRWVAAADARSRYYTHLMISGETPSAFGALYSVLTTYR